MTTFKHNLALPTLSHNLRRNFIPAGQEPSGALQELLNIDTVTIGVSVQLSKDGSLEAIAFAAQDRIVVIPINKRHLNNLQLLDNILHNRARPLCGFSMARLALYIKGGLGLDALGVDLSSLQPDPTRKTDTPATCITKALSISVDNFTINALWDDYLAKEDYKALTIRAWLSGLVAEEWSSKVLDAAKVDTDVLSIKESEVLCRMYTEIATMEAAACRSVDNDFSVVKSDKQGNVVIHNERFKTRVRKSEQTKVVMIDEHNREHHGRAKGVNGKQSTVKAFKSLGSRNIKKITVLGKEELTNAEKARDEFVLLVLQGKRLLKESAFIRQIWLPTGKNRILHQKIANAPCSGRLNPSQANVVQAMTGGDTPIITVHGPPGTGKTSTISAAVHVWEQARQSVWIVAQSNVGVKNIAESLFKNNVPFKLIVSKEFHFEWHEHIYEQVSGSVIRSDMLPPDPLGMTRLLKGIRVMLCTLSMLSNPVLRQLRVFKHVPVQRLVVDEASQIGVFDYMHLLAQFKDLTKLCFFGDPKQLPPYGKTEAPDLQCIFDIKHLKSQSYFLDTQYRMPSLIGSFISSTVYDYKLRSVHKINSTSCLSLIDVGSGHEEAVGKSWKNSKEIQVIEHLVRHYYKDKEFCIITPYDAQRNAIQKFLKDKNLPWEKVFNVDSFQGNEADYVLVSVVRTTRPGFLKSLNRVNVMLTRSKAGMVIVTNKAFMHRKDVKKTLLGKLGTHWEKLTSEAGGEKAWKDWRMVSEQRCHLPGARGRKA